MSLRSRIAVALALLVFFTAAIAWAISFPVVFHPVAGELLDLRAERVGQAADAIARGERMEDVEQRLHIDLRMDGGSVEGPPKPPDAPELRGDFGWERFPGERVVWYRAGPENEVAAWAGSRWVVMHDHDPFGSIKWRLLLALGLASVPIALAATIIASRALVPVDAARAAMEKVAAGDLRHRLDEASGPAELRTMAGSFNRMADQVEHRVRAERQLMAGVSHELRTPLTRMRLELELLRRSGAADERVERIEREVGEVDAMLSELLELSRLEFGQIPLRREPVDLRGLVSTIAGDVQVHGDATANVDPRLLRRAIENLIANSRRHAPGARIEVTVAADRVIVEDDGPGVAPEELDRLFEPFWRGTAASGTGYGLGLAIVRQIAELHGGRVCAVRGTKGLRVVLTLG